MLYEYIYVLDPADDRSPFGQARSLRVTGNLRGGAWGIQLCVRFVDSRLININQN